MSNDGGDDKAQPAAFGSRFGGFGNLSKLGESLREKADVMIKKQNEAGDAAAPTTAETTPKKAPEPTNPSTPQTATNATASAPTPLAARKPEDVSKEELLDILQKMNKRVKGLTMIRTQLTERVTKAEAERGDLVKFFREEVVSPQDLEDATNSIPDENERNGVEVLQRAWRAADERSSLTLQHLQNEYKVVSMQCKAEVEKVKAIAEQERSADIDKLRTEMTEAVGNDSEKEGTLRALRQRDERIAELHAQLEQANQSKSNAPSEATNNVVAIDELKEAHKVALEESEAAHKADLEKIRLDQTNKMKVFKEKVASHIDKVRSAEKQAADEEWTSKMGVITAQHEAEVQKLQQASSTSGKDKNDNAEEQLQELREELSTEHKAELQRFEKAMEESQQKSTEELQNLKEIHAADLETLQSEADAKAQEDLAQLEEELKKSQQLMESELQNLRTELEESHVKHVDQIRVELTQSSSDAQAQQIKELMESHAAELERLQREAATNIQAEQAKLEEVQNLRTELEESHARQIDQVRLELTQSSSDVHAQQMKELVESHAAELERLQGEAATNIQAEQAKLEEVQSKLEEETQKSEQLLQSELEVQRNELQVSHAAQLNQVRMELTQASSESQGQQVQTLIDSHAAELERLQTEATANIKAEQVKVEELKSLMQSELDEKEKSAQEQLASEMQRLQLELEAAHATQIEQVREESMLASSESWSQKLQALNETHESDINVLRAELERTVEHRSNLEAQLEQLRTQSSAEMEQVRQQAAASIEMTQAEAMEMKQNAERRAESAEAEVERIQNESTQQLETVRQEAGELSSSREKESFQAELERLRQEMDNVRAAQVQQAQEEVAMQYSLVASQAEEKAAAAMDQLRNELTTSAKRELEQSLKEREAHTAKLQSVMDSVRVAQVQQAQAEVATQYSLAASQAEEKAAAAMEQLRNELTTSAKTELEQSLKEREAYMQAQVAEMEEKMKTLSAEKVEKVREECSAEFERNRKEMESIAQAKLKKARVGLVNRLESSQKAAKATEEELVHTKQREAEVRSELEQALAKAAAAAQDAAATSAAAKDGEENAQQKVEAALSQQRAWFEESLAAMQEKQKETIQSLQTQLDESNAYIRSTKEELEKTLKQLEENREAALELEKSSSKELQLVQEEFSRKLQSELAAKKKQHLAEAEHFTLNIERIQKENAERIDHLQRDLEEATTEKSKVVSDLKSAKELVSSMEKKFNDERALEKEEYANKLTNLQSEIQIRAQETNDVSQSLAEVESQCSKLTELCKELELAKRDLQVQLESASSAQEDIDRLAVENKRLIDEAACLNSHIEEIKTSNGSDSEKLRIAYEGRMQKQSEEQSLDHDKAIISLKVETQQALEDKENEIADMRTSHEEVMKIVQVKHASELKALQAELESNSASLSKERLSQIEEECASITATKDKEIEDLKLGYEAQIKASNEKVASAAELVKKMKGAMREKLMSLKQERTAADAKMRDAHESEMSVLTAEFKSLRTTHEEEKVALREEFDSEMDSKIKLIDSKYTLDIEASASKREAELKEVRDQYEAKLRQAVEDRDTAIAQLEAESKSIDDSLRSEFEAKMQKLQETHATAFSNAEAAKLAEISYLKKAHEAKLETIQSDSVQELQKESKSRETELKATYDAKIKTLMEDHVTEKAKLKGAMAKHADDLKTFFQGKFNKLRDDKDNALSQVEADMKGKDEKLAQLSSELASVREVSNSIEEDYATIQQQLRAQISNEQGLRTKIDDLQEALQEAVKNSSATASELLSVQDELETERDSLKKQLQATIEQNISLLNKSEEQDGKIQALTGNVTTMVKDIKEKDAKLVKAAKQGLKLDSSEAEATQLREQLNKLKLEETKSSTLLSRLQAEKDASERKHGQRTALVGMLEAQLSELNESTSDAKAKLEAALYDLSQRDESIQGLKEDLEKAEKSLAAAQKSRQKATESSVAAQQAADSKKARMVETLQREIQSLQQQMSKKSSAAQRLLQEREAECMELRKTNKKLQHEVDKGTLSDRRIFELAAKQSNRDTAAVGEIEIRDELVNRLTEKLVSRDSDLATAEINVMQVEGRVEELCRVHRREDVNLDYLKSIVVQYLSKPPGSSERSALLPVLATLLQFDPSDYHAIEAGQQKVSWWGTVAATYIDRPPSSQETQHRTSQEAQQISLLSPVAPKVSSAEVKISKPANGTNGSTPGTSSKRKGGTSLQF